jgi:hypothetical protein
LPSQKLAFATHVACQILWRDKPDWLVNHKIPVWLAKFCGKKTVQVLAGKKTAKVSLMESVAKGLRDCGEPSFTR